jgi:hypothetical protein
LGSATDLKIFILKVFLLKNRKKTSDSKRPIVLHPSAKLLLRLQNCDTGTEGAQLAGRTKTFVF